MESALAYIDKLLTTSQQIALVALTAIVVSLTLMFKNIYFGYYPERREGRKNALTWLAAFCFGAIGGVLMYYGFYPKQPLWFCMVSGLSTGSIAMLIIAGIGRLKKSKT